MLEVDIVTAAFQNADGAERIRLCRQFAAEAQRLADETTSPTARTDYVELNRQWTLLAEEIEAALAWLPKAC